MQVTDKIKLYNEDCMQVMALCKDNAFDLAIVDPEYGIGADKKNSDNSKKSKISR